MTPRRVVVEFMFALLCVLSSGAGAQVVTEFSIGISPGALPLGIATGPDGNLWFLETGLRRIGRITPQGVVTEFSAGIANDADLVAIVAGPDGNLWFTEGFGNRIGRITPQGVVTEFSAGISAGATPAGIALGPDGNLWFTEYDGNRIGRITPQGVVTEFSAGISALAFPSGIASGPDGNLWFTEFEGNRIGRITPQGVVTEFGTGIAAGALPLFITAGPDGNLWFTESGVNRIGRITPQGVVTEFSAGIAEIGVWDIVTGPDGNLWFTDFLENRVGRITPLGVVTGFSAGITSDSVLFGIAVGPDGNIWFTEGADRIGRITIPSATSSIPVIEYRHASWGHYFITPKPDEIVLLDAHTPPFQEWSRTGFSFNVYANATAPAGSVAICRFFNVSFAPKSSHFYAGHGYGCETTLTYFPDWQLEYDKLFNTMVPNANGMCPAATIPVYRMYNNGMGNAPNHRFVTSLAERQKMLNAGFVAEEVSMCVPP